MSIAPRAPERPRKLEFFEKELERSEAGRLVLKAIHEHVDEVMYLVNHNRRVAATWQRNKGPMFIRAAVDSGFDNAARIPKTIDGVTLSDLLLRMADALQRHGSHSLRSTIGEYAFWVFRVAEECESLPELFRRIHAGEPERGLP